jgi:predicted nucleic acid-binding protein
VLKLFPGYVIDTGALIDLWRRRYPRDVFRSLWDKIDEIIRAGEVIAPEEVLRELQRQHDELAAWAKKQKFFLDLDREQLDYVKDIMVKFPSLVDTRSTEPNADPFVIALAYSKGWAVISSENPGGKGPRKRIPDVCAHYDVKCMSLLDFFRDKQWTI